MKTMIAAALLGVIAAAVPVQAQADVSVTYTMQNSSNSYTGAIFHLVRDGGFINAPAVVIEPGGSQQPMRMRVGSSDSPFGVKVWQPRGSCLKVYERIAFVWVRVERYTPQSYGRDVWVTKGFGNTGGKNRVKILRDC